MGDWYYIGHYGQLGPLTREQIDELIEGGVIGRETYVWKTGMSDWLPADRIAELAPAFQSAESFATPPPPPGSGSRPTAPTQSAPPTTTAVAPMRPYGSDYGVTPAMAGYSGLYSTVKSDRSRALSGVLQLILPGVGRIYLGYAAIGVLQLVLAMCFVGYIWSIIDGIIILTGGLKMDGYGRQLSE